MRRRRHLKHTNNKCNSPWQLLNFLSVLHWCLNWICLLTGRGRHERPLSTPTPPSAEAKKQLKAVFCIIDERPPSFFLSPASSVPCTSFCLLKICRGPYRNEERSFRPTGNFRTDSLSSYCTLFIDNNYCDFINYTSAKYKENRWQLRELKMWTFLAGVGGVGVGWGLERREGQKGIEGLDESMTSLSGVGGRAADAKENNVMILCWYWMDYCRNHSELLLLLFEPVAAPFLSQKVYLGVLSPFIITQPHHHLKKIFRHSRVEPEHMNLISARFLWATEANAV